MKFKICVHTWRTHLSARPSFCIVMNNMETKEQVMIRTEVSQVQAYRGALMIQQESTELQEKIWAEHPDKTSLNIL